MLRKSFPDRRSFEHFRLFAENILYQLCPLADTPL